MTRTFRTDVAALIIVVAGLDPAIHHLAKKLDAWGKPAHDASPFAGSA
ncbi:hypothetical protein VRZ08_11835 [Rhodopseudomonas sp. G2_2311]